MSAEEQLGARRSYGRLARPYTLTRGRTSTEGRPLAIETLVEMSWRGWAAQPDLQFESSEIISLTRHAVSVAEVAASLEVPLGVARVLLTDLEAAGHVDVHRPAADGDGPDPETLDSLLDGLRAL